VVKDEELLDELLVIELEVVWDEELVVSDELELEVVWDDELLELL
jgi:hypothetical protein